jgi:hypothetical protein
MTLRSWPLYKSVIFGHNSPAEIWREPSAIVAELHRRQWPQSRALTVMIIPVSTTYTVRRTTGHGVGSVYEGPTIQVGHVEMVLMRIHLAVVIFTVPRISRVRIEVRVTHRCRDPISSTMSAQVTRSAERFSFRASQGDGQVKFSQRPQENTVDFPVNEGTARTGDDLV